LQFTIELSEENIHRLLDLTGYYFEDVTDVEDEDVELMITELLE
jgi:hypothetical protein